MKRRGKLTGFGNKTHGTPQARLNREDIAFDAKTFSSSGLTACLDGFKPREMTS